MVKKLNNWVCDSCSCCIGLRDPNIKEWEERRLSSNIVAHYCPRCQRGETEEVTTDYYTVPSFTPNWKGTQLSNGAIKAPT